MLSESFLSVATDEFKCSRCFIQICNLHILQIAYLTVTRSDCFLNGNSRVDKAKIVLGIELENHKFEYVPKWNKFDRVEPFCL